MISHKRRFLLLVAGLVSFLFVFCQNATEPTKIMKKTEVQIEFELVPYTAIPSVWDSTFYQHDSNWYGDTTAADSLANVLKYSGLPVTDFWFPQWPSECGIALISGSDAILKLIEPDTSVYRMGFQPHDSFPLACVQIWRHYKFVTSYKD